MISLTSMLSEITNKDVSLQRIVSRIEFMATDSVSDILKQFDMEIDGISNQLDIATGQGIKSRISKSSPIHSRIMRSEK